MKGLLVTSPSSSSSSSLLFFSHYPSICSSSSSSSSSSCSSQFSQLRISNQQKQQQQQQRVILCYSTSSSSSSSSLSVAEEKQDSANVASPTLAESVYDDDDNDSDATLPLNFSGCKSCGRESIESGCNGEGRIQGGIATFPGFGWWPIKAYRPCPGFLESGGNYRRRGQSMDEVAFGGGKRDNSKTGKKAKSKKQSKG